ncbi:type I glyceraldehyde-3-phosphate dehydrogenase [bacterium]|nr:MAG: type I glyceraldehyde-3-phosphate dehydrogenase [bacterium]RKZ17377.1 MAG: type I glyceraldehyde-3-phosphate dehydrogenase [bacterium]
MRVAINGFGRIGRSVYRILSQRDDVDVAVVNDLAANEGLAYLLRYDTVMGEFPGEVKLVDGVLNAASQTTQMTAVANPADWDWKGAGIDYVIEATGVFRERAPLQQHLDAGAKRVILTVPAKDEIDATVVLGVNDDQLGPEHRIVSNASCTTNCLAPVAKVLHDNFSIVRGVMTTVHAYTNDQRLADVPHKDLRRSRAAAENIIPTTTGAARAVGMVLPELAGRLDGMAMRVPVPDGSVVDLVAVLEKSPSADDIRDAVQAAAEGPMKGVLQYCTEPVVSSDIIGNAHSSIFDADSTQTGGANMVRILSWYDNEWGYSNRVVDLLVRLAEFDR